MSKPSSHPAGFTKSEHWAKVFRDDDLVSGSLLQRTIESSIRNAMKTKFDSLREKELDNSRCTHYYNFSKAFHLQGGIKKFYKDNSYMYHMFLTNNGNMIKVNITSDNPTIVTFEQSENGEAAFQHSKHYTEIQNMLELKGEDRAQWVFKDGGIIFFNTQIAYAIPYCEKKEDTLTFTPAIKLELSLRNLDLIITHILPSRDPNLCVICLKHTDRGVGRKQNRMFIVWDINQNREVRTFQSEGEDGDTKYGFVNGRNSKAGYLLMRDCYINLDNCA